MTTQSGICVNCKKPFTISNRKITKWVKTCSPICEAKHYAHKMIKQGVMVTPYTKVVRHPNQLESMVGFDFPDNYVI